ncbi:hypothetical protein FH608_005160 [Nonomuraea phyllanthi]|uniref:Uncharacterized protein n=1 Tax=Nonomuraea phyllanthi TaxID=2219224 RepID=A0A5C4WWK5_9ACTN|nr:hypothetical protein [Nonomuraea phyllanthi]KAB8197901.1 hypothetical protein FH608_005160 [Nonomuraea phyllanthi]QFY06115.1 hypothetical protein GBF35_04985 [Nonomuraea phyllanthi]
MLGIRRVAYAGAIVIVGLTGCSASAETEPTGTPTPTPTASGSADPTATSSPSPTATRRTISVQLNPDRVTAGETSKVWILANCPVPTGGPAHTGTATSKAFVNGVVLNPVPGSTSSPAASATPTAGSPWVRGEAQISGTVKRGSYRVDVKCDGTNDLGRATLRVAAAEPVPSNVPSKAPRAGGGGTYAKDFDDESSVPIGPAGALIGLALAVGIGVAVKRRNRA